ncbi:MAG TPA: toll/interleukin-1 receptor domain-containing protein [Polyangiaceae bacterium]|nr:toll/interleukin-1 receptor domain-containing protein [Polyangiaceae bacterium]
MPFQSCELREATASSVTISGTGPVTLLGKLDANQLAEVELIGATSIHRPLKTWTLLEPVWMNGTKDYEASYSVESTGAIWIEIRKGGTEGKIEGVPECPVGVCDVTFSGSTRSVHLVPRSGARIELAGPFPLEVPDAHVDSVKLSHVTGVSTCRSEPFETRYSGADLVFQATDTHALRLSAFGATETGLSVSVSNDKPPSQPSPAAPAALRVPPENPPVTSLLAGALAAGALLAGVVLLRRLKRIRLGGAPTALTHDASAKSGYDVFISHSSVDTELASQLEKALSKLGRRVWLDETTLLAGQDIVQAVELGLRSSRLAIVLVSPAALASGWVSRERTAAVSEDLWVIPVLLSGVEVKDLPVFLKSRKALLLNGMQDIDKVAEQVQRVFVQRLDAPRDDFAGPSQGKRKPT